MDQENLSARLHEEFGLSAKTSVTKLFGEASNRIYFRVRDGTKSFVLMQRPVGNESASEEITNAKKPISEYPFLTMQRFFSSHGIRVPKVEGVNKKTDLILLEDLGDTTLEKGVLQNPKDLRTIYEKAIKNLVLLQGLYAKKGKSPCVAFERGFDSTLLSWEFEHFIEWGLQKGAGAKVAAHELKTIRDIFTDMVAEIEALPKTLTHRDYQSRNLMLVDDEIVLLDFQDALTGPLPYDLVALLRDSYLELRDEDLKHLQHFYIDNIGVSDGKSFEKMFDVQTIQRKLKDGGRFHYINLFKGNPSFLPHVPASYRYVARALTRRPEGKHLLPILGRYLPEFRLP